MSDYSKMMAELKQLRDELRLQLHLASKEAEDEWDKAMAKWDKFATAAQFDKSKEEVGEAARKLGIELKEAFDRFRKAT